MVERLLLAGVHRQERFTMILLAPGGLKVPALVAHYFNLITHSKLIKFKSNLNSLTTF